MMSTVGMAVDDEGTKLHAAAPTVAVFMKSSLVIAETSSLNLNRKVNRRDVGE